MSRVCEITGKTGNAANNVSHANNKTKRRQLPNLHSKRIFIPELDRTVRVRLSTRALRSIDKIGIAAFLKKEHKLGGMEKVSAGLYIKNLDMRAASMEVAVATTRTTRSEKKGEGNTFMKEQRNFGHKQIRNNRRTLLVGKEAQ